MWGIRPPNSFFYCFPFLFRFEEGRRGFSSMGETFLSSAFRTVTVERRDRAPTGKGKERKGSAEKVTGGVGKGVTQQ